MTSLVIFGGVIAMIAFYMGVTCLALGAPRFVDRIVARFKAWAERKRVLAERRLRASKVTMAAHILRRCQ